MAASGMGISNSPGRIQDKVPHTAAGSSMVSKQTRQDDYENVMRVLRGEPLLYRTASFNRP